MAISKEIAISKEMLIDWLREEVPDGAEMRIEVGVDGQLDLVAFSGKDQYALMMGELPCEDEDEVEDEDEDEATNGMLH
jgi:hypothetical protein